MNPWVYRITLALLLSLIFYWLYPTGEPNPRPSWWEISTPTSAQSAPKIAAYQIAKQVSVLGLTLPDSNLASMSLQFRSSPNIAMFTKRQRPGEAAPAMHIEAYFEDMYDEGDRIILGLDADEALLQHIKKSALRPELFPNDVIRVSIPDELMEIVAQLRIKSITIIAGNQVLFKEFKAKFGEPDELLNDGTGNAHFLYPAMGLDFIQPANGLQVLQFVAPNQFDNQLKAPLHLQPKPLMQ